MIRADNAERVKTPHNCSHYAFLLVKEETISLGGHQRGHTLSGNSLVHTHGGHVYCRQTRRESVSRRSAETRISGFFLSLYNDKNLVPELLPRCPCRKPASHGRYFFLIFFSKCYIKRIKIFCLSCCRDAQPSIPPARRGHSLVCTLDAPPPRSTAPVSSRRGFQINSWVRKMPHEKLETSYIPPAL